jgi:hypothetical protein
MAIGGISGLTAAGWGRSDNYKAILEFIQKLAQG